MKYIASILFILLSPYTLADSTTMLGKGDPLRLVYAEMQYLYQVGLHIHQTYENPEDPLQMAQCKSQFGYILTRARGLIGTAGQIEDQTLRGKAIDAGWHAYACASCTTAASSCDILPTQIEFLEQAIKDKAEKPN